MFTPITAEVGAERPESFFLFHFVLITGDKRIRKKSSTTVRSTVNLSQQTSNHQLSKQHVSLENFTPTLWAKVFPSWLRNERGKKFRSSTNELHKSVASKPSPPPSSTFAVELEIAQCRLLIQALDVSRSEGNHGNSIITFHVCDGANFRLEIIRNFSLLSFVDELHLNQSTLAG